MPDGDAIGYGAWDGGYGPKVRATDADLVRLPSPSRWARWPPTPASPRITRWSPVGGAKAGMRIGVIGLGGLGNIGARIAVLLGAQVYAADVNPATRQLTDEIAWPASPNRSPSSRTKTCN